MVSFTKLNTPSGIEPCPPQCGHGPLLFPDNVIFTAFSKAKPEGKIAPHSLLSQKAGKFTDICLFYNFFLVFYENSFICHLCHIIFIVTSCWITFFICSCATSFVIIINKFLC